VPRPRLAARTAIARRLVARLANWIAHFTITLANAARAVVSEAKTWCLELRDRDANHIATAPADHFAVGDIFAQILPNPPTDDLFKPSHITLDVQHHGDI